MTRPLVTAGTAFLAALLALSLLPWRVSVVLPITFLCGAVLLLSLVLVKKPRRVFWCVVVSSALAACICWAGYLSQNSFDFSLLSGNTLWIRGTVTQTRPTSGTRLALTVNVTNCKADGSLPATGLTPQELPRRFTAILYVPGETAAEPGDEITVKAKCMSMPSTPDFDLSRYYRSEGVSLTLSTYASPEQKAAAHRPFWAYPKLWNQALCDITDRVYPQPYSGLVRAILLGDDSQINDLVYNQFTRAGITHIFVVSGMHVSLMAGLFFLLFKKLGLSPRLRGILGCLAAWGFVALTGFGLPAVRAGIMATVMLAGTMFRRPADALNSLCLAGVVITLCNPASILSGSFQLSMTATLGVILLTNPISDWIVETLHFKGKLGRGFADLLGCSFGANLMMFPVIWWVFKGISLVFPLSNLLSVPLLPVVLLSAIASLLPACFGGAAAMAVAEVIAHLTEGILWFIIQTSALLTSFHSCYLGLNRSLVGVWLVAALAILLGMLILRQRKLAVKGLLCLFTLLGGSLLAQNILERDTVKITPVYSFSGVSVVIQEGRKATVVALTDDGTVDQYVEQFCRGNNIQTVENLLLTYSRADNLTDTVFLTQVMQIGKVFAGEELQILPYAQELFKPEAGVYPLRDGHGYELSECPGEGLTEVYRSGGETITLVTVGGLRVGITDSAELATELECEILLYAGENTEKLKKIPLRYVILLTKPVSGGLPENGVWTAYDRQGTLYLDGSGCFRME